MACFVCEKCGCLENTAPSHYWVREEGQPALCSECDPEIGKWHGWFPKKKYTGKEDIINKECDYARRLRNQIEKKGNREKAQTN